jgi:hypothetical protein
MPRISASICSAAIAASLSVSPLTASAQGLLEDCATDVVTYCADVELGHGRTISCLYAHEDKISEQCYAATSDYGDVLDFLFASVQEAVAVCAADIQAYCAGTEFGHGQMLTCLSQNKANIGDQCRQVVAGFDAELGED